MSAITVTFFRTGGNLSDLRGAPVMDLSDPNLRSEVVTSSGTSAQTTNTSLQADLEGFARVINPGTAQIAVACGANPTAVVAGPKVLPASREDFAVRKGDKIAVIDV